MKTIFTLLLSTFIIFSSYAYDGNRLTIATVSNVKMQVEIDGRRYNLNDNAVSIRDLRTGYHTIIIYRDRNQKKNNRIFDFGIGNGRRDILYNNSVYLRNGYHIDILINRFGKALVDEHRIDPNDDWNTDDDRRYDQDRDRDIDRGRNEDKRDNSDNRNDQNNRNNRDPRYDNNNRAMSDNDFINAKESLTREWFENKRANLAKQVFDGNYFRSSQVKDLLQLFTFENNKLELAKYAYGRTVDKGNYIIINDVLTFSNSKDELARYIRDFR